MGASGTDEGDPFEVWLSRRRREGEACGVLQLYDLVARPRGLAAHELSREERHLLSRRALPVLFPGHETTPTSERAEPLEIVAYDPAWPATFAGWRDALRGALGPVAARVEHVGSTSVPGLPAKPVVDVQVSVPDQTNEGAYVGQVESLGVELRSRDDAHRYFRPPPGRPRVVHVHVCSTGSTWERAHLLFRDYLRRHPSAVDAYAAVKYGAADRWADDRVAYMEAKGETIRGLLREAEEWAGRTGWAVA